MAAAEQLITENLDVWSSALQTKSAAGRGKANKLELYGVKKLRELILELAVRGSLVPQDPSDEPAGELLKMIAAAKTQLVKDKKIKKKKPLPLVEQDEEPFELPPSWEWARLGDVCTKVTDGSHNPPPDAGSGYPMLSSQNVNYGRVDFSSPSRFVTEKDFLSEDRRTSIQPNDVLLNIVASIGRSAVVPLNAPKFVLQRSVAVLSSGLEPYFLTKMLVSPLCLSYYDTHAKGTAQKGIYLGKLSLMPLAVPPLAEQARIVAKVDELMALCDQLEQQQESSITAHQTLVQTLLDALTTSSQCDGFTAAWARIADHFDTLFTTEWSIDQLKQTILQLAVMGKLVPQDLNDEPASELLKKIGTEKAQLVECGKIKKQKALPSIEECKKPFDLPDGWEWCQFESLVDIQGGVTKGRKFAGRRTTTVPYLRVANVQRSFLDVEVVKTIEILVEDKEKYRVKNGDLLITEGGDWDKVGRTAIWRGELPFVAHQNHVFKARPFLDTQNEEWLEKYLNSPIARAYFADSSKQTTNLASINKTQLRGCLVAIPPSGEQQRIVAKINELVNLCESVKTRINVAQETKWQLADAAIGRVGN